MNGRRINIERLWRLGLPLALYFSNGSVDYAPARPGRPLALNAFIRRPFLLDERGGTQLVPLQFSSFLLLNYITRYWKFNFFIWNLLTVNCGNLMTRTIWISLLRIRTMRSWSRRWRTAQHVLPECWLDFTLGLVALAFIIERFHSSHDQMLVLKLNISMALNNLSCFHQILKEFLIICSLNLNLFEIRLKIGCFIIKLIWRHLFNIWILLAFLTF